VKSQECPVRFHLGEQAEVLITVATLPKARLVPEAAVTGYDGTKGTVWSVEGGRLKRRVVRFGHRMKAAFGIGDELVEGVEVVTRVGPTAAPEGDTEARVIRLPMSTPFGSVACLPGLAGRRWRHRFRGIVVDALTVARSRRRPLGG
jgi:hypothetical protein